MSANGRAANASQQQAIDATEGPVLIIAGPGSGKTFTLVERIVKLVQTKGVKPEAMLVVTFTEKAARELTTRISNRLAELNIPLNLNDMYLGTFHSICLRFLEEHQEYTRLKRSFNLFDQFDQQFFLYKNLSKFAQLDDFSHLIADTKSSWSKSEELLKILNTVTEEALNLDVLLNANDAQVVVLGKCVELYQKLLEENNSLDFSTIQYETLKLLQHQPKILAELQQKLTYLMVDEYQDTNTIQESILKLLMGKNQNLCVVGDDDQGLYRFRGATIRNILEFPSNFEAGKCKQVKLTVNYRSHPDIIRFYNNWMKEIQWSDGKVNFRYNKTIEPRIDTFPEVPTVIRLSKEGREEWFEETYQFLCRLKENGLEDWNQVAFLFRSVQSERAIGLGKYLEKKGIPVYSPRSNQFFDREEVQLVIGMLIFLFPQFKEARQWVDGVHLGIWDYYDNVCVRRIIGELKKPENSDLLSWGKKYALQHKTLTGNADYAFSGLFYEMLQFPLFSRFFSESALAGIDKGRAARNLAELSSLLAKFEYLHYISVLSFKYLERNLRDLFNQFLRFLKDGGIGEYEDDSEYAPKGCVSFLTIHQSKGLEFPVVISCGLESVPRKSHNDLDELLQNQYFAKKPFEPFDFIKQFDFWRLYYTSFSRAQNLLVLSSEEKTGAGRCPSKYFEPIFRPLPSWRDPVFKPHLLTFEHVKEINLKREYAFTSHILLFEACAEQYRFFKELAFHPIRAGAQLFGTLVHQTIEDIHKAALRGEPHLIEPTQIKKWLDVNYIYLSKRERQYLSPITLGAVEKHVMGYYEREKDNWDRIKEAEVDVSLVKSTYILKGSVDLIRGEDGTVEIIDFKSEKKPNLHSERGRLEKYQRQLELYAHLVEEKTGQVVSRMHLYYTGESDGSPYVTFSKNLKSIEETVQKFDRVVERIESKDYRMCARPDKLCADCDMRPFCDRKNWQFAKEL